MPFVLCFFCINSIINFFLVEYKFLIILFLVKNNILLNYNRMLGCMKNKIKHNLCNFEETSLFHFSLLFPPHIVCLASAYRNVLHSSYVLPERAGPWRLTIRFFNKVATTFHNFMNSWIVTRIKLHQENRFNQ